MKVKELAKMWQDNPSHETMQAIIKDFFNEITRLSKERNLVKNRNSSVLVGIIDEVINKWKQLCKRCEGLHPEGFEKVLANHAPEVMTGYRLFKSRR